MSRIYGWLVMPVALGVVGVWRFGRTAHAQSTPQTTRPAAVEQADALLTGGPHALSVADSGVGRLVPEFELQDLSGKPQRTAELRAGRPLVVALVSSSCPVGRRMAASLANLEAEFNGKASFLFLAAVATDTPADLRALTQEHRLRGPVCLDPGGKIAALLQAKSTTEVFVLDRTRTLAYRGAVSDQYGPTWSLPAPRRTFLKDALGAVIAGEEPAVSATTAPGCVMSPQRQAAVSGRTTFHGEISRIVRTHCQECHRQGGIAPFALEKPEDLTARAKMIETVVRAGRMPPWYAAPTPAGEQSRWANDRTMPAADRGTLIGWLGGGAPIGDPREAPLPRRYVAGWQIGTPDVVYELPAPVPVRAEGVMPYVVREVETQLKEDRWVNAIEVVPTARAVVHHVLVFARSGQSRGLESALEEISGFFGAYVPGMGALRYPPGYAKRLPAGTRLRFQIHYTPNGTATEDRTRIGLRFASGPPEHEVLVAGIAGLRLAIPPGAPDHPETARIPVPAPVRILSFMPHMHVRGKAALYELVEPDGKRTTLLDVPRYDFNWQLYYRLAEPIPARPGSRIEFTGRFDNSHGNPANPDPTKLVRWGPQTFDEMLLGYVEYVRDGGGPALAARPGLLRNAGAGVEAIFQRADKNGDSKLDPQELPNQGLFMRLDLNRDGIVTLEEARMVLGRGLRR